MNAEGYSEAVYKAIENGVKPADALKRLKEILARHGHQALLAHILHLLVLRVSKDDEKRTAKIRLVREKDRKTYKKEIEQFCMEHMVAEDIVVDESLVGGYVLEAKGTRVDASYKSSLLLIYQALLK